MENEFSWLTPWDEPEPIPEPAPVDPPKPKVPRTPRVRKAKPAPDDSDTIDYHKRQILEAIARVTVKPKPEPPPKGGHAPQTIIELSPPPASVVTAPAKLPPVPVQPPQPVKQVTPPPAKPPQQTAEDKRYWAMMCDDTGSGWRHW